MIYDAGMMLPPGKAILPLAVLALVSILLKKRVPHSS
jgi:hypothetical protein